MKLLHEIDEPSLLSEMQSLSSAHKYQKLWHLTNLKSTNSRYILAP
jgi:hypothetical protein